MTDIRSEADGTAASEPLEPGAVSATRELDRMDRTGPKEPGYEVAAVDAFLARAEQARRDREESRVPELRAAEIRRADFPREKGGYVPGDVDAALDALDDEFSAAERRELEETEGRTGLHEAAEAAAELVMGRIQRPDRERFRRPAGKRTLGYFVDDVDAFCAELAEYFRRTERVRPGIVRGAAFREATGELAYDEAQVDAFMDAAQGLIQLLR